MTETARYLNQYERGAITKLELQFRLIKLAVEIPPEQIASELSQDHFDSLREESSRLPRSADETFLVRSVALMDGTSEEHCQHVREEAEQCFRGLTLWNHYFQTVGTSAVADGDRPTH